MSDNEKPEPIFDVTMGHRVDQMTRQLARRDYEAKAREATDYFMNSALFIKCCELAGIPVTRRQAARYREEKGKAFTFVHKARAEMRKSKGAVQA